MLTVSTFKTRTILFLGLCPWRGCRWIPCREWDRTDSNDIPPRWYDGFDDGICPAIHAKKGVCWGEIMLRSEVHVSSVRYRKWACREGRDDSDGRGSSALLVRAQMRREESRDSGLCMYITSSSRSSLVLLVRETSIYTSSYTRSSALSLPVRPHNNGFWDQSLVYSA